MAKCGARTESPPYHLCKQPVPEAGMRCRFHKGKPHGGPKPRKAQTRRSPQSGRQPPRRSTPRPARQPTRVLSTPQVSIPTQPGPKRPHSEAPRRVRPENLTTREKTQVDQVVAFCGDVVTTGWQDAVTTQAVDCITPEVWNSLFHGRRQSDCRVLADMAKSLLDGKKALHEFIGFIASWITGWFGGSRVECAVAKELAKRIPIPGIDQKTTAVARGLQVVGIVFCLSQRISLNRCRSFIDLALAETKEHIKQILIGAMDDWTNPSSTMVMVWSTPARTV